MKKLIGICFILAVIGLVVSCSKPGDEILPDGKELKSDLTRTILYYEPELGYWSPVYCDGIMVDELMGIVEAKIVAHYKDGELMWYMYHMNGEVTSGINGEVFAVHEADKITSKNGPLYTYHFNLVGNMGTHYINTGTLDMNTWTITVGKSVCPPEN